jgi:hypothetical protein
MKMTEQYYRVVFECFAFDTIEQAQHFQDKLLDAFCGMPEAKGLGSSSRIEADMVKDDAMHIKELQNLLAKEKAASALLNAHLKRCHDALCEIVSVAEDAV